MRLARLLEIFFPFHACVHLVLGSIKQRTYLHHSAEPKIAIIEVAVVILLVYNKHPVLGFTSTERSI